MSIVYTVGETVLDIIFKDKKLKDAVAGGSVLNASVSMSRAGLDVSLLSDTGSDRTAGIIRCFLRENGVGCDYISVQEGANTPLALAFLDSNNDAAYEFRRDGSAGRPRFSMPPIKKNDIVLFGSYYSIASRTRSAVGEIVRGAAGHGATVIYDINFRRPHAGELPGLLTFIRENTRLAHIVRCSCEDLMTLFNECSIDTLREFTGDSPVLVITDAGRPVMVDSPVFRASFPVRHVKTVSTIGAGDSFNAGMIFQVARAGLRAADLRVLGENEWKKITEVATAFAAEVCGSYNNYISPEFAKRAEQIF